MLANSLTSSTDDKLSTASIAALLQDIAGLKQEHFVCLTFDNGGHLIAKKTVFIGTLTSVVAHPREIFAHAITDHAAYIIVAHNHPSGDVEPSKADVAMTQQLAAAGQILGIPLRDHVIVAGDEYYSFWSNGLLR